MNHETDDIPGFEDLAQQREWLAQEDAMRRERLQLDPAGEDARSQRYRLLARTLREAPVDALPADFAQQVSALVSAHQCAPTLTLETILTNTLASMLVLSAVVATIIYGATWWPSFEALMPHLAQQSGC